MPGSHQQSCKTPSEFARLAGPRQKQQIHTFRAKLRCTLNVYQAKVPHLQLGEIANKESPFGYDKLGIEYSVGLA